MTEANETASPETLSTEVSGPPNDRAKPYRNGRKNPRNIYRTNVGSYQPMDDWHIGCMFTPEDGQTVVTALNLAHDLGLLIRTDEA